ncbi:Heme-degrading monooxygenase HmoA [Amycolatopsis arida]|uniref:Heme-degrading monooxygenase HmoA n=1 Tax=Amycolatopsis arida TaxID=587909 RepID=A0A1I6A8A5_9PSEU|nr:antibiotic biosynthesis monooxygenase [Amycolatopsis arida]TDX88530.1 heme-degrading monooxygenase HmoA [Amycolatopsis arida]SFQ64853.1 Heme-degrading monooxygenase HmoA [Amycolatopsis arida]
MSDAPFRVILRMEIKPGMEADFERTWLEIGDAVISHPANLGQWLCRGTEDTSIYYIVSDWVDEELFREFEHSDGHLEHRKKLHPFRSGGSMDTMTVVAHLPGQHPGRVAPERIRVLLFHRAADRDAIAAAYHQVSEDLAGTPGLVSNEFLGSVHDSTEFLVMSEWTDQAAFDRWEQGASHKDSTAALRPFQDSRREPSFGVYRVQARY